MERTYLFVSPEENVEVQALGAHWDSDSKRWYIAGGQPKSDFAKWLPNAEEAADEARALTIVSNQAYVAAATVPCQHCGSDIEVICIHCESGVASDEPLTQFTVSHVWAMDGELARQLQPWPNYRRVGGPNDEGFANHCPHCGSWQDDLYLHTEPDDPFFDIPNSASGAIRLTPLTGTIRLNGEEHFSVE